MGGADPVAGASGAGYNRVNTNRRCPLLEIYAGARDEREYGVPPGASVSKPRRCAPVWDELQVRAKAPGKVL